MSLCAPSLSQNAELLSSLESASVRIFKPPAPFSGSAPFSGLRSFQPSGPRQTSTPPPHPEGLLPPLPTGPAHQLHLDSPRMATIQEDPGLDPLLQEALARPAGGARRSFEDLTEAPVPSCRSGKAASRRLQRQQQVDGKETQC